MSDIWQFQQALTRRLAFWAAGSILLGLGMLLFRAPFWNGMAFQFIGWGLVDLLIAWGGASGTRKRRAKLTEEQAAAAIPQETRNLRRILWVNTALDVLYMLGSTLVAAFLGTSNPLWLGTGIGILFQGAFLFFFDWFHAVQTHKLA
ncbi:MAG: DUF6992 family protein [Candidatus Villigracilaceae bacterium]